MMESSYTYRDIYKAYDYERRKRWGLGLGPLCNCIPKNPDHSHTYELFFCLNK